jgi:hypothetical protein
MTLLLSAPLFCGCGRTVHNTQRAARENVEAKSPAATSNAAGAELTDLESWAANEHAQPPRPKLAESPVDPIGFRLAAPSPSRQELACGVRDLVRLADTGFVSYRLQPVQPMIHAQAERFLSATALTGFSTLLVGPKSTQRYYAGEKAAERFVRTPMLGAAFVSADNDNIDNFWTLFLRDDAAHQFHLDPEVFHAASVNVVSLAGFDGRVAIRLLSGAFLFTRGHEVIWQQAGRQRVYSLVDLAPEPVGFASAERTDQFWVFDARLGAHLVELAAGRPVRQHLQFRGEVFAYDVEGERVAVVSVVQTPHQRDFYLQVFVRGALLLERELAQNYEGAGNWEQRVMADRDVCLLPGRSWVAVGGRGGVNILDYASGQALWSELPAP